ncbi:MAG: ThuA domain-containing protein, partial [Microbacterium gubbeenense]
MIAVIATSEGRYRDPWHPFDETSPALASVLAEAGFATRILPVDEALASLDDADLLAVNAGDPWRHDPPPIGAPAAATGGLRRALARGI